MLCSFQKFKTAENKMQEQEELINTLKQELEKSKVSIFDEKSQQKKLETQIDQLKSELSDVQRTERVVRIDLEQATKRVGLLSPSHPILLHSPFKHCYRSSLKCWVLDILKNFKYCDELPVSPAFAEQILEVFLDIGFLVGYFIRHIFPM